MNRDTMIVVEGYAGDAEQLEAHLPMYEHHKCPVVIFSPEDSKIKKMGPHLCRFGGRQCYIGSDAIERQHLHFKMLINEFPQIDFFLFNDSDSFCISPKIPEYLYEGWDTFWSNEVSDRMWKRTSDYELPRIAFHPPWFVPSWIIKRMLNYTSRAFMDPQTPVIDHWLMQLATYSGLTHKGFAEGSVSLPTADPHYLRVMREKIRLYGPVMLHSVKTAEVRKLLESDYKEFLES